MKKLMGSPKKISNSTWAFIVIILLASFLRFYNLGKPSFWVDEMNHVSVSKSLLSNGTLALDSGEEYRRAVLFSYITAGSAYVFGINEWGIRFPSACFGILSLLVIFIFTKHYFGNRVAFLSLFLLSIMPFEIGWSRTARFYTLLQFLSVLVVWLFYRIIENGTASPERDQSAVSFTEKLKNLLSERWLTLLAFLSLFLIAYSIQMLTAFLIIGMLLYCLIQMAFVLFSEGWKQFIRSFYFFIFLISIFAFSVTWFLIPAGKQMVLYGLQFSPPWANYDVAQDRMLFVKFMMGKELFPMGAFFIIGVYQSITRWKKQGIYLTVMFLVPVFLFTFVFRYRMFQYIYNVFPFFIIIASFAVVNLVSMEYEFVRSLKSYKNTLWQLVKGVKKSGVYLLFVPFFLFTEFFSEGMQIPFRGAGSFNGAVTMNEWKEASQFLRSQQERNGVIISTLPLTLKHYLGKADYDINLNDYLVAVEDQLKRPSGEYFDFYSGLPFLENVEKLKHVVKTSPSGFIVVDRYRFFMDQYVSRAMREYILNTMTELYSTPKKTIMIFSWNS